MGVYLEDLTYKEILPILARTGKLIDTRKIIEIDLVRCEECKYQVKQWHEDNRMKDKGYYIYWCDRNEDPFVAHTVNGEPMDFCSYGERRADENGIVDNSNM